MECDLAWRPLEMASLRTPLYHPIQAVTIPALPCDSGSSFILGFRQILHFFRSQEQPDLVSDLLELIGCYRYGPSADPENAVHFDFNGLNGAVRPSFDVDHLAHIR